MGFSQGTFDALEVVPRFQPLEAHIAHRGVDEATEVGDDQGTQGGHVPGSWGAEVVFFLKKIYDKIDQSHLGIRMPVDCMLMRMDPTLTQRIPALIDTFTAHRGFRKAADLAKPCCGWLV